MQLELLPKPETATNKEAGGSRSVAPCSAWREVSEAEFYRVIGPQNVHPSPQGKWPYTSLFQTPNREVRGKTVGYLPEGSGLEETQYLLPKS